MSRSPSPAAGEDPRLARALLDTVGAMVVVLDAEGRVQQLNRACEALTGHSSEQVRGRPVWEVLIPADEADEVRGLFGPARAEDFPRQGIGRWRTRDEALLLVEWATTALVGVDEAVERVIATGIDITARHQAELGLQESEARFRRLAEASFEGIVIHDQGHILDVNSALQRMSGYEREELLGRNILEFVPAHLHQDVSRRMSQGEEGLYLTEGTYKSGETYPQEVLTRQIPYEGRQVRVTAIRDISERLRAAKEREELLRRERQARQAAERAVGLRDEFISVASHELRSPITSLTLAVQGLGALLRRDTLQSCVGSETSRRVEQALQVAERQTARLGALVEHILQVSRLNAGGIAEASKAVDLVDLAYRGAERCEAHLAQCRCALYIQHLGPCLVQVDPEAAEQVLVELLTNAATFGRGRPVELSVGCSAGGGELTVRDYGVGIPPEQLEAVFRPFGRGAASSRHYGGLGLGLTIARGLAQAFGGEVLLQSAPLLGTEAKVILPGAGGAL